ncbi:hypothetical protein ACFO4N_06455 [Camelliibacillus cellulosilyticus]|uniref:WYL domain-containing protein n=1 Tax=Camelliibacillus cellulosilyticus TaxID=2174486 RepID=A0ABV9GJV8_9BACL
MKIIEGRTYDLIYLDADDRFTRRRIRVIKDRPHSVLAYCYDKKGCRTFLKDGMLAMQIIPEGQKQKKTSNL